MYGGESGPDLDSAAMELGLSAEEFVRRHTQGDYGGDDWFRAWFPLFAGTRSRAGYRDWQRRAPRFPPAVSESAVRKPASTRARVPAVGA